MYYNNSAYLERNNLGFIFKINGGQKYLNKMQLTGRIIIKYLKCSDFFKSFMYIFTLNQTNVVYINLQAISPLILSKS